jgi:hypothetical protein
LRNKNKKPETALQFFTVEASTTFSSKLSGITLPDADGHRVQLGSLWASAPAVVVFLRHYG